MDPKTSIHSLLDQCAFELLAFIKSVSQPTKTGGYQLHTSNNPSN